MSKYLNEKEAQSTEAVVQEGCVRRQACVAGLGIPISQACCSHSALLLPRETENTAVAPRQSLFIAGTNGQVISSNGVLRAHLKSICDFWSVHFIPVRDIHDPRVLSVEPIAEPRHYGFSRHSLFPGV